MKKPPTGLYTQAEFSKAVYMVVVAAKPAPGEVLFLSN
jgi:hypothetical protein